MRTLSIVVYLFLLTHWAHAQPLHIDAHLGHHPQTTEAAVFFQLTDIDLNYSGSLRETRFSSMDFVLRERLSARLDGALRFGYLLLAQNTNPIPAGRDLEGGYLGLDLRADLVVTPLYTLRLVFDYRYTATEHRAEHQTVELDWHQAGIRLDNLINLDQRLRLNLAVSSVWLDGAEKASGDIEQRTEFDNDEPISAHLGLHISLSGGGEVILEAIGGAMQGGRVTFSRLF